MADQESKEIEQNNAEGTKESETKTEESVVSQDDAKPNDKSPAKQHTKTPVKETNATKESKKKEEEESGEESDDEEMIGTLDAPLVVEGKRVRKSTEFLSNSMQTPQSADRKKIDIPDGKGETLGSMPRVQFQLNRVAADELKPLHRILYGRPGQTTEVKRNIRSFCGFDIEKDSKEYKRKEEQVDRFTLDSLRRLCEILDVERKGKKEEMLERVMDFLLLPKASGKPVPAPSKKKSSTSKKSSTKRKRQTEEKKDTPKKDSPKKDSPKKKKSDEIVETDDENSEGEEEKVEKEPPAKKAKTPKKETKKPAKKEKKVVSIKISPGKKKKKAKEVKRDSDSSDEEPLSKKMKKSPPTNDEIVELVKELLDGADLEKITMKSICKQVYERFPEFDLTDRKEFIKDSVKEIIT